MLRTALIALTLTGAPLIASAQGYGGPEIFFGDTRKIIVQGDGSVTVVPDRIRAVIHTVQESSEQDLAAERAREKAEEVRSAIISAGIKEADLKTERVSFAPTDHVGGTTIYRATVGLSFTTSDPDAAAAAIDAAQAAGASGVNGPFFEITEETRRNNEREARSLAMTDAVERAEAIAEGGNNFRVGPPLIVNDNGVGFIGNERMVMMSAMEAGAAEPAPATRIDLGQETVSASVNVIFELIPQDPPAKP